MTNMHHANRTSSRRQAVTGVLAALGALLSNPRILARPALQSMKEVPVNPANMQRTSLHQQIALHATAAQIYDALLDAKQFALFTSAPATIDSRPGGSFSLFGGLVVGRNVETIPGQRIVQAWRPTHWDPGIYSIVKFELKPDGLSSTVLLDHTGFPEGDYDHLDDGWHSHYWEPLRKFFA